MYSYKLKNIRQETSRPDKRRRGNEKWVVAAWTALTVFISTLILAAPSSKEREMQRQLSGQVLRFRVVANSDSAADQEEKQRVRDAVLEELRPILDGAGSREETRELVSEKLGDIKQTADQVVGPRNVEVSLAADWFPERVYGECTFPEGEYETLRVRIGEAKGHNWWCVLYPGLCFADAVHPAVSEDGKEELKNVLDEDTYDFLLHPAETKIRFRWF